MGRGTWGWDSNGGGSGASWGKTVAKHSRTVTAWPGVTISCLCSCTCRPALEGVQRGPAVPAWLSSIRGGMGSSASPSAPAAQPRAPSAVDKGWIPDPAATASRDMVTRNPELLKLLRQVAKRKVKEDEREERRKGKGSQSRSKSKKIRSEKRRSKSKDKKKKRSKREGD